MNWKKLLLLALIVVLIVGTIDVMFDPSPIQDCNHLPKLTNDKDIGFGPSLCTLSNWFVIYPVLRIAGGILWIALLGFTFWSILIEPEEKWDVEDATK
jgi:hypothetical protein